MSLVLTCFKRKTGQSRLKSILWEHSVVWNVCAILENSLQRVGNNNKVQFISLCHSDDLLWIVACRDNCMFQNFKYWFFQHWHCSVCMCTFPQRLSPVKQVSLITTNDGCFVPGPEYCVYWLAGNTQRKWNWAIMFSVTPAFPAKSSHHGCHGKLTIISALYTIHFTAP